jgi:LuxR family maltose regulon positive regulatory protein
MGGPPFESVTSKLRGPWVRPGTVRRSLLIERLARGDARPIVSVEAPAGYGKTTLLAQWAERNGQAFAWVSLDERDNDPKVLLTYVAEALDAVEPIHQRVFDVLASAASPVVPALGFAFSSMTLPVVLVLDDVHVLHDPECCRIVGTGRLRAGRLAAGAGRAQRAAAAHRALARRGQDLGDRPWRPGAHSRGGVIPAPQRRRIDR